MICSSVNINKAKLYVTAALEVIYVSNRWGNYSNAYDTDNSIFGVLNFFIFSDLQGLYIRNVVEKNCVSEILIDWVNGLKVWTLASLWNLPKLWSTANVLQAQILHDEALKLCNPHFMKWLRLRRRLVTHSGNILFLQHFILMDN